MTSGYWKLVHVCLSVGHDPRFSNLVVFRQNPEPLGEMDNIQLPCGCMKSNKSWNEVT